MKKVLVITYYWPPSGGAGVQRWLKFVKYFRNFGWEPIIYTPENPESPARDETLIKDIPENINILKTKIREPYSAYKQFVGRRKDDNIKAGFLSEKKEPSITEKLSVWIRGNLFIPDARKYWIKPSVKFLSAFLRNNKVDAIVSTGPPHSMHLIARKLRAELNIPWLADFRDPWTNIDFYHELMLSKSADRKHHKLEKLVLKEADKVVVVSRGMADDFRKIWNRAYDIITNGYDSDDCEKMDIHMDKRFSISHVGSMVKTRNPEILWMTLKELLNENSELKTDLEVKLIGQVDYSVDKMIENYGLQSYVTKSTYLNHSEVSKIQKQSQILLLLINNTPNAKLVLTGKLFEYLNAGRPILCIGPEDGNAAEILRETNAGQTIGYNDKERLKSFIISNHALYKQGKLNSGSTNTEKYSRKNLTKDMTCLLDEIMLTSQ